MWSQMQPRTRYNYKRYNNGLTVPSIMYVNNCMCCRKKSMQPIIFRKSRLSKINLESFERHLEKQILGNIPLQLSIFSSQQQMFHLSRCRLVIRIPNLAKYSIGTIFWHMQLFHHVLFHFLGGVLNINSSSGIVFK